MYKITIKGDAKTKYPHLSELNGVSEDNEDFVSYFDAEERALGIIGSSYLRFEFDPILNKLFAINEYTTNRLLSEAELALLADYTQGQWSDGIGEGFDQFPCKYGDEYEDEDGETTEEVFISPWHQDQVLEVTQVKL